MAEMQTVQALPGPPPPDDSKSPVVDQVATAVRNIFEPVFDGLMRANDDTLNTRGQGRGLKLYDELERDPHCYAVLQKRKMAVIGREWSLEPASKSAIDKAAADMVQRHLESMEFDRICYDLLDAILKGFAVGEIMWEIRDSEVVPVDVLSKSQRRFKFDFDSNLRMLTFEDPMYGEAVPERKFVVHRFGGKDDNPYGLGLGTVLFWLVYFKRQVMQFRLTYLDKFGSPTALGKYPVGAAPDQKMTLLSALSAIAQESQIAIPMGMEVSLLEAAKSSNNDYDAFMRYLDDEMTKCVLCEIKSTSGKSATLGSNHASVDDEVRLEIVAADTDLLAAKLNKTLIAWDVAYNMPLAKPPRLSWDISEPTDRFNTAQADKLVFDMGYEPSEEYIQATYGDGWTKKPEPVTPPPVPGFQKPSNGLPPGPAQFAQGGDAQAILVAQAADPSIGAWVAAVRGIVESATDIQDLRAKLMSAFPQMSVSDLAKSMQAAFAAAQLAGRYDLTRGISP